MEDNGKEYHLSLTDFIDVTADNLKNKYLKYKQKYLNLKNI